jgi:trehalose-6-phosphatase
LNIATCTATTCRIQAACRHWFKDPKVGVVGPHGEVVQGAEIERHYQTLLDAGKL